MPQKSIYLAAGTFAVGAVLGLCWPNSSSDGERPSPGNANLLTGKASLTNPEITVPATEESSSEDRDADFAERLKGVTETPNALKRSRAIAAIADGLDLREVREALETIDRLHIVESKAIRLQLFSRWAELDPGAAFAHAREKKDDDAIGSIMKVWASNDLALAQAEIAKMPESVARRSAVAGVIEGLSEVDPKRAFELAQKSDTFENATDKIFQNWVEKDPQEAASHVDKLGPKFDRRSAIYIITTKWADMDLQSALRWAESLPENDAKVNFSTGYRTPVSFVVGNWIDRDPAAAMRWLEERPVDSRTAGLLTAVSAEIAETIHDPILSGTVALMLPPGAERDNALNTLTYWWRSSDFEGALDWAEQQGGPVKAKMFPLLALNLGNQEPEARARYAARLGDAVSPGTDVAAWASEDPAAAAESLRNQPPDADRLVAVAGAWLLRDPNAASEWINTIASGEPRDKALSELVGQLAGAGPELAIEWSAKISDEKKRHKAYEKTLWRWLRADSAAAREWLSTAPVPEDLKAKWLKDSAE